MKSVTLQLGLCFALLASSGLTQSSSAMDEFDRMDSNMDEMECALGNCCAQDLKKTTDVLRSLRNSVEPLKGKLQACEGKLSQATGQSQQQLAQLQSENQQLKAQLTESDKSRGDTTKIILYSQRLEGQVTALKTQVKNAEAKNSKLAQENNTLRQQNQQLAQASKSNDTSGQVAALSSQLQAAESKNNQLAQEINNLRQQNQQLAQAQTSSTTNPVKAVTQPTTATLVTNNKRFKTHKGFTIEVKSFRRVKNQIQSTVRIQNKKYDNAKVFMMAPVPTIIDNLGQVFRATDHRHVSGVNKCQNYHAFHENVAHCREHLKKHGTALPINGSLMLVYNLYPASQLGDEKAKTASFNSTLEIMTGKDQYVTLPIIFDDIALNH